MSASDFIALGIVLVAVFFIAKRFFGKNKGSCGCGSKKGSCCGSDQTCNSSDNDEM